LSLRIWQCIVAVFGFTVVFSCFALISLHLAWYRYGIRLHCGGILLRPYLFTSGMVTLQYSTSLWWYPVSPLSLHTQHSIVAVFSFAVAVSCFALISSHPAWYHCGIQLRWAVSCFALVSYSFLQVVVAALGHGGRERGLWREIIDCVEKNPQTSYRAPSFIPFPPLWT